MNIPYNEFKQHNIQCSNRTKICKFCNRYIPFKNFEIHTQECYNEYINKIKCSYCDNLIKRPLNYKLDKKYYCDKCNKKNNF